MLKVSTRIGKFIDRQQKLVREAAELMEDWEPTLLTHKIARRFLTDFKELDQEMVAIVTESPVGALQHATFGWACYEVRNAQINLVFLMQFGVNHAQDPPYELVKPLVARGDLTEEEFAALTDCVGLVVTRMAPSYAVYGGVEIDVVTRAAEGALDKVQQAFGLEGGLAETRVDDEAAESER